MNSRRYKDDNIVRSLWRHKVTKRL